MKTATIYRLLLTVLNEFATGEGLTVAAEDRPYKPSPGSTYLRPRLLMGQPEPFTLGRGMTLQPGVLQIDILSPARDGWKAPTEIGDRLCQAFHGGLNLADVGVDLTVRSAGVGPAMSEEDRSKRPVSVNFRAFMTNT